MDVWVILLAFFLEGQPIPVWQDWIVFSSESTCNEMLVLRKNLLNDKIKEDPTILRRGEFQWVYECEHNTKVGE